MLCFNLFSIQFVDIRKTGFWGTLFIPRGIAMIAGIPDTKSLAEFRKKNKKEKIFTGRACL